MKILVLCLFVSGLAVLSVPAQSNIRDVDFKNFTYSAHCAGEKPSSYKVTDGEYSYEKQMDGYTDRLLLSVMDVSYGDLNADKRDEAIVLTVCNTGGTGNFSEGFVYAMKSGKPSLVARIAGGDRAYGGLRKASVENGLLVVERNDAGTGGASCCPLYIVATTYRLAPRGGILKAGKETRREIYPKERVAFAKGMSSKTFSTTIPGQEGKRFLVGARNGQTLTVSINTDKASIRLLEDGEDDAEVDHGNNSFVAKLRKNGDYTIEVQNDADVEVEVRVTIKIQ